MKKNNLQPISKEYTAQREILDWYTSLGSIRTKSSDNIPATIVVDVALGYKKDDKACSTEISQRSIELKNFFVDTLHKREFKNYVLKMKTI